MKMNDKKAFQVIGHTVMIILTLLALLPLLLILMASLTDDTALVQDGYRFFPRVFSLAAYNYIFSSSDTVLRAYGISIMLTVFGTMVSVVITTMLAYALAKKGLPVWAKCLITLCVILLIACGVGCYMYFTHTGYFAPKAECEQVAAPAAESAACAAAETEAAPAE